MFFVFLPRYRLKAAAILEADIELRPETGRAFSSFGDDAEGTTERAEFGISTKRRPNTIRNAALNWQRLDGYINF
jgi:hypothetical protein